MSDTVPGSERTSLRELAALFFRLGATAFGGPAAHIAMMRDEVVNRRGWLTDARFLDLLSATNLIPGPNSTEMAMHIGWERRRGWGLVVAGALFIGPAMVITGVFGWAYVKFGARPEARGLLAGVQPVVLALVAHALVGLAKTAARTNGLRALAVVSCVAAALGVHELLVLLGAGLVAMTAGRPFRGAPVAGVALAQTATTAATSWSAGAASAASLPSLFWVFAKVGSVLFGSGYVLLAFLRAELVERLGWLNEGQLIDAIAVGQITPGPVFTAATFIGYVLLGPAGALVATAGIFLPAFIFVALSGPLVPRLRASPRAGGFLDGVNVASLALMAVVTAQLARAALVDVFTVAIGFSSAVAFFKFRVNSTILVLAGAVAGGLVYALGLGG